MGMPCRCRSVSPVPVLEPRGGLGTRQDTGAGAALTIVSSGSDSQPTQVGWTQLTFDGGVSGFAICGTGSGNGDQEAVVPLETRNSASYVLWFDNTRNVVVGVALANISKQPVSVDATIRDETAL